MSSFHLEIATGNFILENNLTAGVGLREDLKLEFEDERMKREDGEMIWPEEIDGLRLAVCVMKRVESGE